MPIIKHHQFIEAPVEICFDLARNVDIHTKTTAKTKETAVDGVTHGLLEEGDTVTWEATHLGIKQRLIAKVTHMKKPIEFVDSMLKGSFHSFTHKHQFVEEKGGTMMIDTFEYKSPFGPIGLIADKLFLEKYMTSFIISRAKELKSFAENRE
ncbi:Ligand-binding SRPBCC domain-containing protein [Gracilibacillus orientalis]|uniref:Ligand-binding SRPBCC domain-containing protein n=1 Tax=Gracilibacillus orientalis TaxID=334253 RepID=A0A1I4IP16_9BACI|nr:SRPBCC family protein [Gracilibacillus orientalis]SFL56044.1 Ligand-binding SRPBCC domain-containing protein [Gracilibacillus orientalis]